MTAPEPGSIVAVRARRYLVEGVVPPKDPSRQTLVSLSCLDDDAQGDALQVLWERELDARVLDPVARWNLADCTADEPRRFAAWLLAQRWNLVTATTTQVFQAPHRAGIRIDAYQLEPLRKALELPRVNLFIADDVGLGKTIEAALILRELILRQRVRRVVVAAPPSVVRQWQGELSRRFGLDAILYDRDFVTKRRRERGWTLNPWTTHSRFIISHALLRDESYAAPLRDWLEQGSGESLLILDEAHNIAPSSGQRYAVDSRLTRVIRELAPCFDHRLFLSATPHNGHSNSFSALMEILDPQRFCRGVRIRGPSQRTLLSQVMVRRLKADIAALGRESFPRREVVQVEIEGLPDDAPELALSNLLDRYRQRREAALVDAAEKVRLAAQLVLIGLQKRLLSSIDAFARTLDAHARGVAKRWGTYVPPTDPQLAFKLVTQAPGADDEEGEAPEARVAAEEEAQVERGSGAMGQDEDAEALLRSMLALARQHRGGPDARIAKLVAWIRKEMMVEGSGGPGKNPTEWSGRRLILFTEYVDTANWLVRCLQAEFVDTDRGEDRVRRFHGALDDAGRVELQRAFNDAPQRDPLRILVCTDAAREGVNLQAHCADLFHLDIPWNPSRMEQRNGRIDRKLQPAPVVRCHYFHYAQRAEDRVLEVLVRRTRTAHHELGGIPEVLELGVLDAFAKGLRHAEVPRVAATVEQLAWNFEAPRAAATDATADRVAEDQGADDLAPPSAATAMAEADATRDRQDKLLAQLNRLDGQLEASARHLGIDGTRLRLAISAALDLLGLPPLEDAPRPPGLADFPDCWRLPPRERFLALDRSWDETLDTLRPQRPREQTWSEWRRTAPLRAVVFKDTGRLTDDVVHLHLDHPLVRRLLGRFLAQGFVYDEMSRVCVLTSEESVRRVVLFGRVSLYGHGAARLHDELVAVAAQWPGPAEGRKEPLKPYGRETLRETTQSLEGALTGAGGAPANPQEVALFQRSTPQDIKELLPELHRKAVSAIEVAATLLGRRAEAESSAMREILEGQRKRIQATLEHFENPNQEQLKLLDAMPPDERRQFESDREHWRRRLREIDAELVSEPRRIARSYEVRVEKVEPLGVVYLTRGTR